MKWFERKNTENSDKKKNKLNIKYLKNGSYSMMLTAIFLVMVVVINLIISEIPSKYTQIDVSKEQLYSMSEESKNFLQTLEKDVVIYHVVQDSYEDEIVENLLKKYEEESKHIQVEKKDPVINPKFVSQYTTENLSSNSLIVVCGERVKVVSYDGMYETSLDYTTYSYNTTGFDGEGQITSAISYVTAENLPKLYIVEGHGEIELDETIRADIEKANIQMETINLLTEGSIPEDAKCIMMLSPVSDISEEEKEILLAYLEEGGTAFICSDYTENEMKNFDSLLENYGVKRAEGLVFEGDSQYYAMQMPYYLIPDVNSTEFTSQVVSEGYYVLAPYAQGIQKLDDVRDTLQIESLLTTSDKAYSKVNTASGTMEQEEGDIQGPFDIGVSITETVNDQTTQIVYFSTVNLLESQVNMMVSGGNEKLIMGVMNQICSSEETVSVSVPSKSLEVSYLTLTAYDSAYWKIIVTILIPGVFLVLGFLVWFKRRKA